MRLHSPTGERLYLDAGERAAFLLAFDAEAGRLPATGSLPIHILLQLMGHASTKVTEIYLQMVSEEQRRLVMEAWES